MEENVDYTMAELQNQPTLGEYYPDAESSNLKMDAPGSRVMYWYHPDYLGNVELITESSGEVYEFFFYNPWGESLYEWQSGTSAFTSPYRFNGKELDPETGLHYYGARYYNSRTSIWLSVDPKATHPSQLNKSPYSYSWNNPVKYQDPDGECPFCIPIVIGLLLYPEIANAPTGNKEADAAAMASAKGMQDMWLITVLTGGAALASGTRAAATFVTEEAFSYMTGLPFSPRDLVDVTKSVGRTIKTVTQGSSSRSVVIGGGMDDVKAIADQVDGVDHFIPTRDAKEEFESLSQKYKDMGMDRIPDDVVKETQLYKENADWIQNAIDKGATIIDIGPNPNGSNSTFYNMETEKVYQQ